VTEKIKKSLVKKKSVVEDLISRIDKSSIMVITDYRGESAGLKVKDISELRKKLRATNSECKIVKNTLTGKACEHFKIDGIQDALKNPTAVILGYKDPVQTAKTIVEFAKDKKTAENLKGLPIIKAGYIEGRVVNESYIRTLAELPSKEVLYSQLLRTMQAPISGVMNCMTGTIRNLIYCLNDLKDKKEKQLI